METKAIMARPGWGIGLALFAAVGFSMKAVFVKKCVKYTQKMSHSHV